MALKFFIAIPVLISLLFAAIALLVLFIMLCIKKPKLAAILALILIALPVLLVFAFRLGARLVVHQTATVERPELNQYQDSRAPIWSPGIENEFESDVYPSKISAVRGLGRLINKKIPYIMKDIKPPDVIVIYQGPLELEDVEVIREVIEKMFSGIKYKIENGNGNTVSNDNEVGIRFSRSRQTEDTIIITANIFSGYDRTNVSLKYMEKLWVENFSDFLNRQPHKQFIVARSTESCLTQAEANQQAMEDACIQVGPLLTKLQNSMKLSYNDILKSGLIVDRFVQSFEGSAGKIWRQALLLDVSGQKLNQLADNIAGVSRARRITWVRMFFSVAGLFVLITVVYAFLNAATKGYYAWSLRIAGIVLALIVIFLFLA